MEETMETMAKIIRRSIYTLLKDFHYFIANPVILLLPFSASILLYQSFFNPDHHHDLDLCQLIFSYVFNLPFALSSLIIAKAFIVQHLDQYKHSISSLYLPLVLTYLCNIILTIIINITTLFLLRMASNFIQELFGLSSKNPVFLLADVAVLYIVLTNTMIICNIGLIMAGMNKGMGYRAIHRAYNLLRKGTNSMALCLALPINLGLAAVQFLFRYRIVRADHDHLYETSIVSMVIEGLLIAYMFSILVVLDTIVSCLFIKKYESDFEREQKVEICCIQIEFVI